jgi:hypothetical protein
VLSDDDAFDGTGCGIFCGGLIQVDAVSGMQTAFSSNVTSPPGLFADPKRFALDDAGVAYVAESTGLSGAGVIEVALDGAQTAFASNSISPPGHFAQPVAVAIEASGDLVVADGNAFAGFSGGVIRVDRQTGAQTPLSSNAISPPGFFDDPRGIFVVPPECAGRPATLYGDRFRDSLRGTPFADVLVAGDKGDTVSGLGAADVACGEAGRDRMLGGRGRDRLLGGAAGDRLIGGAGRDRLIGGPGRDVCIGGPGRDRARGCEVRRSVP